MRETETKTRARARQLRANMPVAEQLLWSRLRRRQVCGYKFRRQQPIGPYIADFACLEARLIVEVDGPTHTSASAMTHDTARTAFLIAQGWRIHRVWNADIYRDLNTVIEGIGMALPPSPSLASSGRTSPASGGGIRSGGA